MGLFGNLFGSKKSYTSVLINTQNNIFNIYGVNQPTDAQKMKASVYLCIAGLAILDDLGCAKLRHSSDRLIAEAIELTDPLSMRLEELSNNTEQLDMILSDFPKESQVTGSTNVNGLAAFKSLFSSMIETLMIDFSRYKNSPTGPAGYAPFVVGDGIFGEGRSQEHFMELTMQLANFMTELSEVTRLNKLL